MDKNNCGGSVARGTTSVRLRKSQNLGTLKMESICSSESSILSTLATRSHITEDNILHPYFRKKIFPMIPVLFPTKYVIYIIYIYTLK
jgi:hypothetical protein